MAAPPLLGASSKHKKDDKTYIFDLCIGESNEETYPEYSWKDLVAADQAKDRLASSGKTLLDPYASDDEDNLKAMAAKFEKKYKTSHSSKRKRRAEDYIDRGAGYDETDSFIDNSDVYDEVVPADLETVRGGFYINSGSLDFKEVEISDEEETSIVHEEHAEAVAVPTTITTKENGKSSNGNHHGSNNNNNKTPGEKVMRPSLIVSKKPSLSSKTKSEHHNIVKSKGNSGASSTNKSVVPSVTKINSNQIEDAPAPKKISSENESSSSGSSSSESSSSDGSSTSSSDSSSSGEDDDDLTDFKEEKPKKQMSKDMKKLVQPQRTTTPMITTATTTAPSSLTSSEHPPPVKRLKTKNVPPNPNLPKNKILNKASSGLVNVNSSKDSMIVTSTCSPSPKLISRPMQNVTPITSVSNLGLTISHGMTASNIKVPTPKTTPTGHSTQTNATNLMGLNLVKQQHGPTSSAASSAAAGVPKQKSLKTKMNLPSSLLTDQGLIQNTLNLVNSAFAAQSSVPGGTSKKKPKVAKMTANSTRNSLCSSKQPPQQQRPPKLKPRPRLKHMVPLNLPSSTIQNASNLSQSLPSFSRPSQQPSLASQRVEITKIKPHSNTSPSAHHHQLSSSIKSLSNLGTGIFPVTVTEVKEKVTGTSSSASFGGTTSSPRSRSPNVGGTSVGSHSNNNNASRLPQSLTITPTSPLLNISSSSAPTSTAGMNLSNIMSPIPISRGNNNSLLFGQQQLTTTSSGFSMNTILGKEYPSLNSSTPLSSKDFFADQNLIATMAYNINLSRETHKK